MRPTLRRCAMTLFEVLIAIALIGLIMGMLMSFFHQTIDIRAKAAKAATRTQVVRQTLSRMADELRHAGASGQTGFPMQQCAGTRRKLTFVTSPLPPEDSYIMPRPGEAQPRCRCDLVEVTYELWVDPDQKLESGEPMVVGILRTEKPAMIPGVAEGAVSAEDQETMFQRRDLIPEFGCLEFRYFDGQRWTTTWSVPEGNALPHLVQVTVGFDSLTQDELDDKDLDQYSIDDPKTQLGPNVVQRDRFAQMVRLPAADEMFSAARSRAPGEAEEIYESQGPVPSGGAKPAPNGGGSKAGPTPNGGSKAGPTPNGGAKPAPNGGKSGNKPGSGR